MLRSSKKTENTKLNIVMSNAGRPKAFKSPEELYSFFKEYKDQTKNSPIMVHDFVGKDGDSVYREREQPLTMDGFECFLFEKEVIADLGDYLANKEGRYEEFATICSRIRKEIRADQIKGGMTGIYNASITQRLNGLVDKSETRTIAEQPLFIDPNE